MIVYKITNTVNNKVYIGITEKTLDERWNGHLSSMRKGDSRHLYCAMRKYGVKNFNIEIIDTTDEYEDLLSKEKFYISKFNSTDRNIGYNMTYGGDSNQMDCPVTKEKHLMALRDKKVRDKISTSMKKYRAENPFTEEHRKKLSEKAMGNHNFGNSDTRSVPCYCMLDSGDVFYFHNYKLAGKWWFETFHPFGDSYAECTFQRKIKDSINGKDITYGRGDTKIFITGIKWYKGGVNNE